MSAKYRVVESNSLSGRAFVVQWKLCWLFPWEDKADPLGRKETFEYFDDAATRVDELNRPRRAKTVVVYPRKG